MRTFTITAEQEARVEKWLREEVYPIWIEYQKLTTDFPTEMHHYCWGIGYPYEGAIGGGLSYEFTPTSIGTIEAATYPHFAAGTPGNKFRLDLTDYDLW